ncbi:hypothetical protein [Mycobacterium sp.]|uniref:hypothetical protein n=1 Tax=Mycobacterium sp. TaxID=1785 RepID=UPI003D0C97D1
MKPADEPQVHVGPNAGQPGRVTIAVGSGTDPFSVTPEFAIELAGRLLDAATESRDLREIESRDVRSAASAT